VAIRSPFGAVADQPAETATLAYLLHLETTGRAERLPGEVEHWRPILP
jgi:hypothetical protein